MDEESNIVANVSLGAGIATWVVFVVHFCLGCVPFLGMFAILLFPVEGLLALTAIICGGIGISTASGLEEGTGRVQAMIGVVMGVFYFLFVIGLVALGIFLGIGIAILDSALVMALI